MMITFLDVIILAAIALFLVKKLKDVLGTRPDNENNGKPKADNKSKIIDINLNYNENAKEQDKEEEPAKEVYDINDPVDSIVAQIASKVQGFTKDFFLKAAKQAFEMILEAYAIGDTKSLKKLLTPAVYDSFSEAIKNREAKKQVVESQFIGFKSAEIVMADINKNEANITVKFISEQVNLLKNDKGEVIEGDPNFIETVTDVWTFTKSLKNSDPTWALSSTKNA